MEKKTCSSAFIFCAETGSISRGLEKCAPPLTLAPCLWNHCCGKKQTASPKMSLRLNPSSGGRLVQTLRFFPFWRCSGQFRDFPRKKKFSAPKDFPGLPRTAPDSPRTPPGLPRTPPDFPRTPPDFPRTPPDSPGLPPDSPGLPRTPPGLARTLFGESGDFPQKIKKFGKNRENRVFRRNFEKTAQKRKKPDTNGNRGHAWKIAAVSHPNLTSIPVALLRFYAAALKAFEQERAWHPTKSNAAEKDREGIRHGR